MITSAFDKSLKIFTKHWWVLILMSIPTVLLQFVVGLSNPFSLIWNPNSQSRALLGVGFIILSLISSLFIASLAMGIAKSIKENNFHFKNAFVAFSTKYNWPEIILITIIVAIATAIGCFLLIVPGVILSVGLCLWYYVYQNEIQERNKLGPIAALKATWEFTKGYKWPLLGLQLIFVVISWVIALAIPVGAFSGMVNSIMTLLAACVTMILKIIWIGANFAFYQEIKDNKNK